LFSQGAKAQTNNAYGDNQVEVESGIFAIYSGDLNQDGFIDLLDQIQEDNDLFDGISGYHVTDLNGDGFIDLLDQIILDNNLSIGIGAVSPAMGLRGYSVGEDLNMSQANKNN
jgi:hypothetical protein